MILQLNNINLPLNYNENDLIEKCAKKLKTKSNNIKKVHLLKKSIDARKNDNVHYVLNIGVEVTENYKNFLKLPKITIDYDGFEYKKVENQKSPVIVGLGPSGLFCALVLSKMGFNPIVLEQGKDIDSRKIDVDNFWNNRTLNKYSNVQYGEGGAGTFSDGKLNTNINDKYNKKIINEFIKAGAPFDIYYNSKPHIGSDNLPKVVQNIRNQIIKNGGKVLFNHKFCDFNTKNNKIVSVNAINLNNGEIITIDCDRLILGIGHSSLETFQLLKNKKLQMQPKPFAIGVRIEQNQNLINSTQYGLSAQYLGSADYKLVTHLDNGRNVFTFCMCPGGQVVASSCEENTIVTNGMSNYNRDLKNSNCALLVNVKTEDFYVNDVLDGFYYQRKYEKMAFDIAGCNYDAPIEYVKNFLNKKYINKEKITKIVIKSQKQALKKCNFSVNYVKKYKIHKNLVLATYSPNVKFCNIKKCLPNFVSESLQLALPILNTKLPHFADDYCVMTAIETKSSCPVQITRDDKGIGSINGIYPIGEGAGYAGGIMTSALDGVYCAEKIYNEITTKNI